VTSPPPSDKKPGGFVPPPPGYLPPGARDEPAAAEPTPPAPEPEPAPEPAPEPLARPPASAKPVAPPAAAPAKHATPPPAKVAQAIEAQRLPRVAWFVAVPGVAALVSAVLPWFAPTGRGVSIPKAFCLQAGRIGFLAPLAIIVAAVVVLGPRVGMFGKAQPTRRLDTDGLIIGGAGVAAAVMLGLTWLLLPNSYSFTGTTWDRLNAAGHQLTRGPQAGYLIGIAAAVLAIICGVLLLVAGRRDPQ
jgi:hypothetical protein